MQQRPASAAYAKAQAQAAMLRSQALASATAALEREAALAATGSRRYYTQLGVRPSSAPMSRGGSLRMAIAKDALLHKARAGCRPLVVGEARQDERKAGKSFALTSAVLVLFPLVLVVLVLVLVLVL